MRLPTPNPGQAEVLSFIRQYIADNSKSPTVVEIADGVDCAISTASTRMQRLTAAGWMSRDANNNLIVAPADTPTACPHCGVTA
jgi:hypothetical protein